MQKIKTLKMSGCCCWRTYYKRNFRRRKKENINSLWTNEWPSSCSLRWTDLGYGLANLFCHNSSSSHSRTWRQDHFFDNSSTKFLNFLTIRSTTSDGVGSHHIPRHGVVSRNLLFLSLQIATSIIYESRRLLHLNYTSLRSLESQTLSIIQESLQSVDCSSHSKKNWSQM